MTAHYENMLKIEDIRREHGAYISAKPVNYTGKKIFAWEILYKSGSWISYGYQEEQPELKTYEGAIAAALKYYYENQK